MNNSIDAKPYTGRGDPGELGRSVTEADLIHPRFYVAPPGLVAAVNVARELGMPLLLTGEPGCGKSQLAHSVAWEFGWGEPLTFTVKSDTHGRDLFYSYDTLGRFHAAHITDQPDDPYRFLHFNAMGKAICRALGSEEISEDDEKLAACLGKVEFGSPQSVVLIDEIDKAPREVPNDILNEINEYSFEIPELPSHPKFSLKRNLQGEPEPMQVLRKPFVIMTSNRERELPEAFLRRCVYYHLELPPFRNTVDRKNTDHSVTIEDIIRMRLGVDISASDDNTVNAKKSVWSGSVSFFAYLRKMRLQKIPSTAELLSWLWLLHNRHSPTKNLHQATVEDIGDFLPSAKVTLFKHMEDQKRADALFEKWRTSNS
ncbi:MAG: MoxR family ATPase [Burkholderiales bacterium]|nr:MoxR family ATPase [Burkholderiales bacterium]MDR4518800.1 MoxR family ATPase [Nitrosomonas sp.]